MTTIHRKSKAAIGPIVWATVLFVVPAIAFAATKDKANEIQDCTVISEPGVHTVTRNLPAADGLLDEDDCIVVDASSVVLDLGYHSITGPGTDTGRAITDNGVPQKNIRIRRGTISGFSIGIDLAASSGSVVEHIQAFDNSADGIVIGVRSVALYNVAVQNDRGLVQECPANAIGNAAWDNVTEDLVQVNPSNCSVSEGHNSFGTSGGGGGGGTCESLGFTDCFGTCTDTETNEANCGACGFTCVAGELCSTGVCSLNCQAGLSNCLGFCTNTQTNEAHCGACGSSCVAGEFCDNGNCTTP